MSSVFGVLHLSGQPLEPGRLEKMRTSLVYWNPDQSDVWHRESVGLGQLTLRITPESVKEQLPYTRNGLTIVANARIDNRKELAKLLDIYKPSLSIPDSDLILRAYQKWGEKCPAYLIGEFAFAIWDEKDQSLFCAKDTFGIRPLFYTKTNEHFLFSSEIKGLLASGLVKEELNDLMLAIHLLGWKGEQTQTSFKDIFILPAAHWLKVSGGDMQVQRYWDIDIHKKIRLKDNREYEEAFLEHLKTAVRRSCRSDHPIGCLLSGGLDSTALAGVALRERPDQKLNLYSWAHPKEQAVDYDDRVYIEQFLELHKGSNFKHQYLHGMDGYFQLLGKLGGYFDEPFRDIEHYTRFQSYEYAKRDGVRTIISGVGGDELASNFAYEYFTNLFFDLRWTKMYKELRSASKVKGHPVRRLFKRNVAKPVRQMMKGKASWAGGNPQCGKNYLDLYRNDIYIAPDFLKHTKVEHFIQEHIVSNTGANLIKDPLKKRLYLNLNDGNLSVSFNQRYLASLAFQAQYTYPFLDRDLVSFCFSLPIDQFHQNGMSRSLIRRSLANYVPSEILNRQTKYATSPNFRDRIIQDAGWLREVVFDSWKKDESIKKVINAEKLMRDLEKVEKGEMRPNSFLIRSVFMAFFLRVEVLY